MEAIYKIRNNDKNERKWVILWRNGGQRRWSHLGDRSDGEDRVNSNPGGLSTSGDDSLDSVGR
jgi:hypothetical protein